MDRNEGQFGDKRKLGRWNKIFSREHSKPSLEQKQDTPQRPSYGMPRYSKRDALMCMPVAQRNDLQYKIRENTKEARERQQIIDVQEKGYRQRMHSQNMANLSCGQLHAAWMGSGLPDLGISNRHPKVALAHSKQELPHEPRLIRSETAVARELSHLFFPNTSLPPSLGTSSDDQPGSAHLTAENACRLAALKKMQNLRNEDDLIPMSQLPRHLPRAMHRHASAPDIRHVEKKYAYTLERAQVNLQQYQLPQYVTGSICARPAQLGMIDFQQYARLKHDTGCSCGTAQEAPHEGKGKGRVANGISFLSLSRLPVGVAPTPLKVDFSSVKKNHDLSADCGFATRDSASEAQTNIAGVPACESRRCLRRTMIVC
jgi:hypothetical protein